MAAKVLVTIGTDGVRDFVDVPGAWRYTLGSVSVAQFVASLASSTSEARRAIDAYLKLGKGSFRADPARISEVLSPRRQMLASPLIPSENRTPLRMEGRTMASVETQNFELKLAAVENQLTAMGAKAASQSVFAALESLVTALKDPDYVVVAAKQDEPAQQDEQAEQAPKEQEPAKAQEDQGQKTASYESLKANADVVESILATVDGTNEKIDRLVAAGKRFNAAKAKSDLHKIASKVSEIVANVDLAAPWVKNDLVELARQADTIHSLFPANV
jgi:hypothetical protein